MPVGPRQTPDRGTDTGWETPGSSGQTAYIVGCCAVLGATTAILGADLALTIDGLEKFAWAMLPAVSGAGAGFGAWLGWRLFGQS